MPTDVLLAFSTFPDADTARQVALEMVEGKFAACANIFPAVESVYRWQGNVERASEALALFKVSAERYAVFQSMLKSRHPYDVPEIVAVKIADGLPEYLRWAAENCG